MHYLDDTSDIKGQRLVAQVHLETEIPTLSVEEIDHHFQEITCSKTFVTLRLLTASAKQAAFDEFSNYEKFFLITSHATCNEDGERALYLVSAVTDSRDNLDLLLSVTRVSWRGPQGISVQCKNCTVIGTIDILQGSVSGNTTSSTTDDNDFSWDQGSFTFKANGFFAHIELEATVQPSVNLLSFEAPMPSIGIPGFQIPGIGIVGPIFKPAIVIGTQISSELDFTYGFNLTVPNNSSIYLDLTDPESSTITGFPNSTISPLPFTASINNLALTLSASFRPQLLLGISLLASTALLGAGVFFNLPTISTTISQVAHVDRKCETLPFSPSSPTNSNNNDTASVLVNGVLEDVFGSLTHVEESIAFEFGVLAEAKVKEVR
ncbi:MAG: hypothetical protein Q9218_005399, partial [Villophora microphyllina]